jgi:hypothetical protein
MRKHSERSLASNRAPNPKRKYQMLQGGADPRYDKQAIKLKLDTDGTFLSRKALSAQQSTIDDNWYMHKGLHPIAQKMNEMPDFRNSSQERLIQAGELLSRYGPSLLALSQRRQWARQSMAVRQMKNANIDATVQLFKDAAKEIKCPISQYVILFGAGNFAPAGRGHMACAYRFVNSCTRQ